MQDVIRCGSVEAWVRLLILTSCVLGTHESAPGSESQQAARNSHRLILRRAQDWEAGRFESLAEHVLNAEGQARDFFFIIVSASAGMQVG